MFTRIATFEFKYQIQGAVFWVTFGIFFLLTFGSVTVEQIQIGSGGNIHKNAPMAIATICAIMSLFAMFILVAFVSNVIVRDDETGFGPIVRATRVSRLDYLLGRFTGAFAAGALAFASVPLGVLVGSFMPWVDPETLSPFRAADYLYAYGVIALPALFVCAAIFFAVATVTRSMAGTYMGVVAFLVAYFGAGRILADPDPTRERISALIDPFGIRAINVMTKYWTAADRNSLLPPLDGLILANRLIWFAVALAALALAYALYRAEAQGAPRAAAEPRAGRRDPPPSAPVPAARLFGPGAWRRLALARARFEMTAIFRSPAFPVLLLLGIVNAGAALWIGREIYGNPVYPVTRFAIQTLFGAFSIINLIVAIYYGGDLVWRDRDRRTHEIIDACPIPDWAFLAPKILAITGVLVATNLVSVATAILIQILKNYWVFEFDHYLVWYVVPGTIAFLQLAILSVFVQSLSPNKYMGWGIMGLYLVSTVTLSNLGYEHNLYHFGDEPEVPLSDMNGQGRFWIARVWFEVYWSAFCVILAVLAHGLWRRGAETRLRPRLARLPRRLAGPAGALMGVATLVFVASGAFIYYNTNILNTYRTSVGDEAESAAYERAMLPFEAWPAPRVVDVVLDVDLAPHEPRATTKGQYVIENRGAAPLDKVLVRWVRDLTLSKLELDGARETTRDERFHYAILTFDTPMAPGERRGLRFETTLAQRGFRNSGNIRSIVDNGTFLNNFDIAPLLAMDHQGLLTDRVKRRKHGLPAELRPPKLEDDTARAHHYLRRDSDWVTADITITTEADQTPMAPGYKVADDIAEGRRRARFKTEAPIQHFFSIQSAAYAQRTAKAGDVDLTVYYHPAHPYNVDGMLGAMKASLELYGAAFSPYQFRQARILEIPFGSFAQSFANTIPYTENLGFLVHHTDPDKIDMIAYVTAHEIAHQWWAHQVIGADMQGGTMLSETFAQYSAIRTIETVFGQTQIRRFLKYELDSYLRSRGGEVVEELPLVRVEDQPYIHYRKGSLVMYFLKEELGADVIDGALRRLIADYAFKPAPYPSSKDFVRYLREAAGPAHDALITDLFEKITLYDVKVHSAEARPRSDGQFDVTMEVEARKLYADGLGKETEAPLDEPFEVGLFLKEPGKAAFGADDIVLQTRAPIHGGRQTLSLVAPKAPTFAGVDPYNKRITRNSETVLTKVSALGAAPIAPVSPNAR